MADLDWQANERIGEIVWDAGDQVIENVTIWLARLGLYTALVIDRSKVDGTVWATVGSGEARVGLGHAYGKWPTVDEAKEWAEKTMRARLAADKANLDELAALEQEMGLY